MDKQKTRHQDSLLFSAVRWDWELLFCLQKLNLASFWCALKIGSLRFRAFFSKARGEGSNKLLQSRTAGKKSRMGAGRFSMMCRFPFFDCQESPVSSCLTSLDTVCDNFNKHFLALWRWTNIRGLDALNSTNKCHACFLLQASMMDPQFGGLEAVLVPTQQPRWSQVIWGQMIPWHSKPTKIWGYFFRRDPLEEIGASQKKDVICATGWERKVSIGQRIFRKNWIWNSWNCSLRMFVFNTSTWNCLDKFLCRMHSWCLWSYSKSDG